MRWLRGFAFDARVTGGPPQHSACSLFHRQICSLSVDPTPRRGRRPQLAVPYDRAKSAEMKSFVTVPAGSDFPLENLPYGVFSRHGESRRCIGVAIGDYVLNVALVAHLFRVEKLAGKLHVFHRETLNDFMALGKPGTSVYTVPYSASGPSYTSSIYTRYRGAFRSLSTQFSHSPTSLARGPGQPAAPSVRR